MYLLLEGETRMDLLIPLIIMGGLMYFTIIRPQKQQMNEKKSMMESIKKGDHVITLGGLHGIVDEVQRDNNLIIIDCEGVFLTFELNAIAKVVSSTSTIETETVSETVIEDTESVEETNV